MTQLRIPGLLAFATAVLLSPWVAAAQSGTVTDDAFLSANPLTQGLNLNGQGSSLIVAGSSASTGIAPVGPTAAYIKFQLQASLPSDTPAGSVAKATLKVYLSPATKPSGEIDLYPITSDWSESAVSASAPPVLGATPFASAISLGTANSFLVIDVTQLVQAWLDGPARGGLENNGMALVAHTGTSYAVFDSKENIVTGHEPRLEIVLQGAQKPLGTQGPQDLPGPLGPVSGITGITAGTDLTGGGTTGNVTLNLNVAATDARYAQLGASNIFTTNQAIRGDLHSSGSISAGNSLSVLQTFANGVTDGSTVFNVNPSGNITANGGLSLGASGSVSVDSQGVPGGRLVVLPSGAVGVGTPTPSALYKLDVAGNAHIGGNNLRVEGGISAGGQYAVAVDAPSSPGGRFLILPNGNVGINNSNPQTILDVAGNVNVAASGTATGAITAAGDIRTIGQISAASNIVSGARVIAAKGFAGRCNLAAPVAAEIAVVTCNQFDVAETVGSLEPTEPGDLLIPGDSSASGARVRKSFRPYDDSLLGVVSTSPGLVLDGVEAHLAGDNSTFITPTKAIVGLAGRVPVKVSMENGPIRIGDPLTSSSTPGVAMKATQTGKIVGYALEPISTDGKVLLFVQPGFYMPPKERELLNQVDELKAEVSALQDVRARLDNLEHALVSLVPADRLE